VAAVESATDRVGAEPAAAAGRAGGEAARAITCSIVVPVHNKASLTRQCLNVLMAQPSDARLWREVIAVDDGSTDLTPRLLAGYGERIRVVSHAKGRGFAAACNAGAAVATGDYLVLLNNDTIPRAGWLWALARYAEEHPRAAVVGAKLLFPNDTIQHAGVVFGQDRYPHHLYIGFPANHPAAEVSRRFQAVTAACCLIRRDAWEAMGGFDTGYVNGWEDVDLCLRLGEAGHEVHYCHESVVYHLESSTRDLRAPQERANRQRYVERWRDRIEPDDVRYWLQDGLLAIDYAARHPFQLRVSPLLAGVTVGEAERLGDRLLAERAKQVAILLRNSLVMNTRVAEAELRAQEAELRAGEAERRAAAAEAKLSTGDGTGGTDGDGGAGEGGRTAPAAGGGTGGASSRPGSNGVDSAAAALIAPPAPATAQMAATFPIIGSVERPSRVPEVVAEDILVVSGWAISKAGIFRVETLIDGEVRGNVEYGVHRPDAAALHPGYPDGERCGFFGAIPVADLADGPHALLIRVTGKDGRQAEIGTRFEVDSTARARGKVLGRLDRPVPGEAPVVRDRLLVAGWAVSPHGIRTVEALVGDEVRGVVPYGALRPDIGISYPSYPDSSHSGFTGVVPLAGLADGEHTLRLRITAHNGVEAVVEAPFVLDASAPLLGEVPQINAEYGEWLAKHEPTAEEVERARAELAALADPVTVSLLVPLTGVAEAALAATAASVAAQAADGWQLCLAAGAGTPEGTRALAERLAAGDERVVVATHGAAGREGDLAAGANAALAVATGEFVALLPAGDRLSPLALADVAKLIAAAPGTDLVYVDEDRIDAVGELRWDPFFRPDWSPDLLLSAAYVDGFVPARRSLVEGLGGFRPGFAGAEVYDLVLRATDGGAAGGANKVGHAPRLLVSRRGDPELRAGETVSAAEIESRRRAVADALARRGVAGVVEPGVVPGTTRVRYALPPREALPGVTVVMPTGGKLQFLRPCLEDLLHRTSYPNLEVLLVDNSDGDAVEVLCEEMAAAGLRLRREVLQLKPFNFSALINHAIGLVETPYVLLLNDDVTVVTPGWIEAMLEQAQQPGIGVVGPKLLYPDGTIQHVGVFLGPFQGTCHAFKQFPSEAPGWFGLPNAVREYSAVTFACALLRREIFEEVGLLDAEHLPIAFNDTEFCLRVGAAGYRVLYTPHAVLTHHESVTKQVIAKPEEIGFLRQHWGSVIDHDPYYNPNLTRRADDCSLNMD